MSLALSEDHISLAETVADFLTKRDARGEARSLLDGDAAALPSTWSEMAELGWLGLHLPEDLGGSGFGLETLVVVIEQTARAVAPGPFVPTTIASALISTAADGELQKRYVPGLADGTLVGAAALGGSVEVRDGKAHGSAGAVLGADLAGLFVVLVGDDVAVVELGEGVSVETPPNLDPTRRSSKVSFDGAPAAVISGAAQTLRDVAGVIIAAEAVGLARECTDMAAEYAKTREQFGRPIAMYQAVKHHCANMAVATDLATSAVWDAANAASNGGDQLSYAAAIAVSLSLPAADLCANLNTQVHGGIAMTWEHDAHLYMRRATTLLATLDVDAANKAIVDLTRAGVTREGAIELPPEAEAIRAEVRTFVESIADLEHDAQREALVDSGYAVPHWPAPHGRDAGAVEQLVIEEEFKAAGIKKPGYGITAWNILTIIQHGTDDQIARWIKPALNKEVIWCQLFSEPDAGSDAAGVKTKGTRVDGGWLVNGQKVWTSEAHLSGMGFATVRTNPDVPKHQGITMMVIDMHGEGVEVRPIKMPTGSSDFNEVFFNDVFVPDDDVVGPVDGGWTVARATLGNESVSIGSLSSTYLFPNEHLLGMFDANPDRLSGGAARLGSYLAHVQGIALLNLRTATRAVSGGGPGPEGAVSKLVLSEVGHLAAAIVRELTGPDAMFFDGAGAISGGMALSHRAMSIAGGTSEIKRNQIGERILGLPRDPLIK